MGSRGRIELNGKIWYWVQGEVVKYHCCNCPYCREEEEVEVDVEEVVEAKSPRSAGQKVLNWIPKAGSESVAWEEGSPIVTPLPDDQQLKRAGYELLPGLGENK